MIIKNWENNNMDLRKLLDIKRKVDDFAEKAVGLSKEEKRNLEVHILKPDKLPPIRHKVEYLTPLRRDYVKLQFRIHHDFDLFCKHFKVLNYVETNVTDLKKLIAILKAMDSRTISYDYVEDIQFPVSPDRDIVKLVFSCKEDYDLFKRHFKVLTSKELKASELTKLLVILQDLEDEKLVYEGGEIKCSPIVE
jgi:hypothetical protein